MPLQAHEAAISVLIMAVCTLITRALPFLIFPAKRETPKYISYLGKVLPFAIIGMLVVYCLKDAQVLSAPYGLPELITIVAIVLLHVWQHKLLLSIGGGTVLYVVLVQFVFV